MSNKKDILENKEGYTILPAFIPHKLVADFRSRLKDLYPVRGIDSDKKYAERDDIKNLKDVTVWWSQMVDDFTEFKSINKLVEKVIQIDFPTFVLYSADTVTINPNSNYYNPHVDTPHRFNKYNFDKRCLGIQCIITLDDVEIEAGATGLVPFSQKRDFDINKCYTGEFDRWFMQNAKQHYMSRGTLLFYNCRVLHSSMPNKTNKPRTVLLINYMDKTIINDVKNFDNIWVSNGRSS